MFQTLDEQIEMSEGAHPTTRDRVRRLAGIAIVAVAVFGGLLCLVFAFE